MTTPSPSPGPGAVPQVFQRGPSNTGEHLALLFAVLVIVAIVLAMMVKGYRTKQRRTADLPPLPQVPEMRPDEVVGPVAGLFLGTTTELDWMDRVLSQGLSHRAQGTISVTGRGVLIRRTGEQDLWLPLEAVTAVRVDGRHAGKTIGKGTIVVVSWKLGDRVLESGFRCTRHSANTDVARALEPLLVVPEPVVEPEPAPTLVVEPKPLVEPEPVVELEPEVRAGPVLEAEPDEQPEPVTASQAEADALVVPPLVPVVGLGPAPEPVVIPDAVPVVPAGVVTPEPAPREAFTDDAALAVPALPVAQPDTVSEPVQEDTVAEPDEPADQEEPTIPEPAQPGAAVAPAVVPMDVSRHLPVPSLTPALPSEFGAALVRGVRPPAIYVLEDGKVFRGTAYGATGETFGEAVFCTAMTGYQETLTDPSYHRQVVAMTAPHIGNTGVNAADMESQKIWVAGFVVRDPARVSSSWRSEKDLDAWLAESGIVGISGIDTRALTKHLRTRGSMRVGVASNGTDPYALLAKVKDQPWMDGADLAREVSTEVGYTVPAVGERKHRVVAVDLGIKAATPRSLAALGCEVVVVPATATAAEILALAPDGVFYSNGPGDPKTASYAIESMQGVLGAVPVFGICMGNQILGHALGLGTYKLPFGHRGTNQPVMDRVDGRVKITAQNHGFAVQAPLTGTVTTPHGRVEVSHVGLNDQVVEGLRCLDVPAFSVQFHPEAAAGPHDASGLFGRFCDLMSEHDGKAN